MRDEPNRVGECDELRELERMMGGVRAAAGFASRLTDVDLSNGVAMLQIICVVPPQEFVSARGPNGATDPAAERREIAGAAATNDETEPAAAVAGTATGAAGAGVMGLMGATKGLDLNEGDDKALCIVARVCSGLLRFC